MRKIVLFTAVGVLALGLAGVAFAAANGIYSGTTSQVSGTAGEKFELEVSHNKVVVFEYVPLYSGNAACSRFDNSPIQVTADRGSVLTGLTIGPLKRGVRIDKHGFFADKNVKLSRGDYFTFSGTFHAGKVSGKFSEHFKTEDPSLGHDISCKTGTVKFKSNSHSAA
jgi:hypothetical protein